MKKAIQRLLAWYFGFEILFIAVLLYAALRVLA